MDVIHFHLNIYIQNNIYISIKSYLIIFVTVHFTNFVFQYLYSFGCALETGDDARRTGYIYVMTSFRLPFPLNRRGKNMAHPVLVHFNQLQSALMSNLSGFLSGPGFCLHIHENICSCISGENPMLLDYRSLFGRCLSISQTCRPKQAQLIH